MAKGNVGLNRLSGTDRIVVALMVIVPTLLVVLLVWIPAVTTVGLSFTNWDGIKPLGEAKGVGLRNYQDVVSIYPRGPAPARRPRPRAGRLHLAADLLP